MDSQMIFGSPADKLKRFFAKHGGAGLVLPDGWYGRPFDSLFALARAADIPDGLEIEIEGGRTLYFRGSLRIVKTQLEKHPAISIEGFQSASWTPNDGVSEQRVYGDTGSVLFVS
jgi:hypothetical protein